MYMDTSRHQVQTEVSRPSVEDQATLMSHINIDPCKQILTLTLWSHSSPALQKTTKTNLGETTTLKSSSSELSMHHHSLRHAFLFALGRFFPSCPMHIHEFLSGTNWLGMYKPATVTRSQVHAAREPGAAVGSYHMVTSCCVPNKTFKCWLQGRK